MTDTRPPRIGEEIDEIRLADYLVERGFTPGGDLTIEQFLAGSSNLTYLVRIGVKEYVLRRPPFGNTVSTAHDMRREFEVLSKLSAVYPPAPRPLIFSDDESIIGSEFYLMERRHGLIISGSSGAEILNDPDGLRERVCRSFIKNLAELHAIDYKAAGLGGLGRPEGYPRRQVEGWTKRYFASKTHQLPDIEKVMEWLNENIPDAWGASLIHNDYKFDNVMLDPDDPTRITAVLDWEMVTAGDPLMDLGTTLGYWMSPDTGMELMDMPFNPRVLMEKVSGSDLLGMYEEVSGRKLPDMTFYYVFGTFKIAVIAQQIYARFSAGKTSDRRFQHFDRFVAQLASIAVNTIQAGLNPFSIKDLRD